MIADTLSLISTRFQMTMNDHQRFHACPRGHSVSASRQGIGSRLHRQADYLHGLFAPILRTCLSFASTGGKVGPLPNNNSKKWCIIPAWGYAIVVKSFVESRILV